MDRTWPVAEAASSSVKGEQKTNKLRKTELACFLKECLLRWPGKDDKRRGRDRWEHLYERAIDASRGTGKDDGMNETMFAIGRRSKRRFHKMRVQALGRAHDGRKFKEICETQVVNEHGGLLFLRHEVDNGETLVIVNPLTQEEQECRIVFVGEMLDRGQRVGVEFLTPAPHFWGIDFGAGVLAGSEASDNSR
jgi:hypothetical protein